MSFRRLLPVRKKAEADKEVTTLQNQDRLSQRTDLTEVARNAEAAIQTPSETPASSHTGLTADSLRRLDLKSEEVDISNNPKSTLPPGGHGKSSETAAPSRRSLEVVRDVRSMQGYHDTVVLSPGSGKLPEGWELMLDEEYGLPYLLNSRTGATTLGFPRGWEVREYEQGVYFVGHNTQTVTRTDPRFAVHPIREIGERLALQHTFHPHSCDHCCKIIVNFKSSLLKKATLRSSFNNIRVLCADSVQDIDNALGDGCPFFARLFRLPLLHTDIIPENGGIYLTVKRILADPERDLDETGQKRCIIFYKSERLREAARVPQLVLCGAPQHGKPDLVKDLDGPLQVPDVDSPATFAWARQLLDACDRDHESCQMMKPSVNPYGTDQDFTPSRLIEVANDPKRVQVVDMMRENLPQDPVHGRAWACLSYAWGGDQIVKTTKANLAKYTAGIPLVVLPPTIRDAVKVCRGLGLKYLWVDCLCIVQDSDSDMEHELRYMAKIYQHAYVTIVAACASGVWQGFLHNRGYFFNDDDCPPPTQLQCLGPKGEETSILAFAKPKRLSVEDKNPIEERGWTYQERWLSQRVLYYGFRGLTYFCRLAQVSNGCRFDYYQSLRSGIEDEKLDLSGFQSQWWHECIEEYSQRQMFDPDKNKFNAISAVAQKHGKYQQYAAGLWRDSFGSDLAWYVVPNRRNEPLNPRPQTYRAPSWSWASVDNAVSFWLHEHYQKFGRRELEIVRITTTPVRLPFGLVEQGAEMDVIGDVASVAWVVNDQSLSSDIVTRSGVHFKAFPDTAGQADILSRNLAAREDGSLRALVLIRDSLEGLCGLILQRISTASKFRRVGFFLCCDAHRIMAKDQLRHRNHRHQHHEGYIPACSDLGVGDFQDERVVVI